MSKILDFGANFVNSDEKMSQKKEVRKMKKFLGLLLVLGLMTSAAFAINPDSVQLTVTVGGTSYSVFLASATNTFGTVNLGNSQAIVISSGHNDGNVTAEWEIAGTNADVTGGVSWTLANTAINDQYILMVGTSAVGGVEPSWAATTGSSITASQAEYTTFGKRVLAGTGAARDLWGKIVMPPTSTDVGTFSFTVSLWATAPD